MGNKKSGSILMIMFGRHVGGAELQFIELANHLVKKYDVRFICLGGTSAITGAAVDGSLDICAIDYGGKLRAMAALIRALSLGVAYRPNVVVTTSFIANVIGLLVGKIVNAKTLSLQTVSKCMKYPIIDRAALKRFDVLIAGANDIKKYLLQHGMNSSQIVVVHNWVDFSKRETARTNQEAKARFNLTASIVIGCIARLHHQKGHVYLLRAFSLVADKIPDSILILVGDGDEKESLIKETNDLRLTNRVMFLGELTGSSYNEALVAIDIYVQPSLFEGLPRTLLDAMYMGKPVVASEVNGNAEAVIDGKTGLLVPSGDVQSLSEAIIFLITHPCERDLIASAARDYVISNFDMQKQLQKIENLLTVQ